MPKGELVKPQDVTSLKLDHDLYKKLKVRCVELGITYSCGLSLAMRVFLEQTESKDLKEFLQRLEI